MAARLPSFTLNTGAKIPAIGMGCFRGTPGTGPDHELIGSLKYAIKHAGYRHLDTATMYQNEADIGNVLKEVGVRREELFIVTKLTLGDHDKVEQAIDTSLKKLQLDYVDLYLMHWPQGKDSDGKAYGDEVSEGKGPTFSETWREMEDKVYKTGKAKAIGVSNFSVKNLTKLLETARTVPAVNQVESHPYHPDWKLDAFCKKHGIHITNYSPMGGGTVKISDDPDIKKIADKHGVAPGSVILSWTVQRQEHSAAPKSANETRMTQNVTLVNLPKEDLDAIDAISANDPSRRTRLCGAADKETGLVFGWTVAQLGFDIGECARLD